MSESGSHITDAELALLSLLVEQPMHGYQIEQTIEERGMREWTQIGFSSIYYILEKMKGKGWLSSTLSQGKGKGPARQIFQLTETGRKIWRKAVLDALANPHRTFSNFSLGLSNLAALDKTEILTALEAYRRQLEFRLEGVNKKLTGYDESLPWEIAQLFDYSLTQIKSELEWVSRFITKCINYSK
jgi:DNA-binding PadR family transcriptional regulator